jgi:nitrilase
MRHIALEGRCFVLSANQFTKAFRLPADINNELASKPDDIVCFGGSCIVGPMGNVLAGPDFTGESILFADLDLADVARAKYDFDVTGHYARPDPFHLEINEHPQKPVVSIRRDTETTA